VGKRVRLGVRKESSPGRSPRRRYALLAALAAAAALVAFPGLSGATPTDLPDVTTGAATSLTNASATLNGTVNPNDPDTTAMYDYTFTWSTAPDLSTTAGSGGGTITGTTTDQSVSSPATGLSANTTYYFQLCAVSEADNTDANCGSIQNFTTDDKPTVTTTAASAIGQTTATLNGTVDPNDPVDGGNFTFSWGTKSGGPYSTGSGGGSFGAGTSAGPVSFSIPSGLTANTTYYFELCATNDWGKRCGGEQSFTTVSPPPTETVGTPTGITSSGVTLSGTVNPNGAPVSHVYFEYSLDMSYGSSTNATPNTITASLTSAHAVQATLTGLQAGATFHYKLCATNTTDTSCNSSDNTFTTYSLPTAVLSADTTSGPAPLTVTFDGSASSDPNPGGAITSWKLTFGDGSAPATGTGAQLGSIPPHTYANPCSCMAKLTVTDAEGDTDMTTLGIQVNVNQPPVASLTAPTTSGTVPLTVTFDGSGSFDPDGIPLQSWSLDFGDGSNTGLMGPGPVSDDIAHTYTTPGNYTATLTVTDSSNATDTATVSITVNPQPSISINDVSQYEPPSGTTNFVFTLTLSATSTNDVKVNYATADGTATAGTDYNATSGTLKIPAGTACPGDPSCQITVQVIGSTRYESAKTFKVNLSNPVGATIADGTGTGTILNNNPPPLLIIQSGAAPEGNTGSLVSGTQTWGDNGSLQLGDASGFPSTAGAHTFYTSTPGQVAITKYTYQGISGNTLHDVSPAGSVNAGQWAFQPRTITLTVLVCDPVATIGTDPGDCVPTTSGSDTTVKYSTSDGHSADTHIPVVEGQDYVHAADTLDIPAGAQSGQINVWEIPNTTPENLADPTEDVTRFFFVNLASPSGATIRWGLGSATIIDDDGLNPPPIKSASVSAIGADHATVCTVVNPNGAATDVWVQYGTTDSYGKQTPVQSLPTGFVDQSLCFTLTGLSAGTTYDYQVVADHPYPPPLSGGVTTYGDQMTFPTDKLPIAVLKADKTNVSTGQAVTFNGSASSDPDGSISSWKLDFGDGSSASGSGPMSNTMKHKYTSPCSCTASLTVTDNQGATSKPAKVVIKVSKVGPLPLLSALSRKVGPTSAKVSVHVDPNGAPTKVWVEYGTTPSNGSTSTSVMVPRGSAKTVTLTLTGLNQRTSYYFHVVASHTDGGQAAMPNPDATFKTPKLKPIHIGLKTRTVTVTGGVAPIPFTCKGNAVFLCHIQVLLELGSKPVGSKSFTLLPGHSKIVRVKLTRAALRKLSDGPLHLTITVSLGGASLQTMHVTVLP